MTLTFQLTSDETARLAALARKRGLDLEECARQVLTEHLPSAAERQAQENAPSIALLESWLAEDATDDPEEIAQAQKELDEFKAALNAERGRAGARPVY